MVCQLAQFSESYNSYTDFGSVLANVLSVVIIPKVPTGGSAVSILTKVEASYATTTGRKLVHGRTLSLRRA
ncbi:hypothetical protein ANAPC5_01225 [Anaplasma phagocytophilum]|nr:hypothetical protein ANAPC5_01225 [Anaplasma phagocytophilum]